MYYSLEMLLRFGGVEATEDLFNFLDSAVKRAESMREESPKKYKGYRIEYTFPDEES